MKKLTILMAVLVLVTLMGSFAQAEACYNLSPFSDVIRLGHVTNSGHQSWFGNWSAGTSYSIPVTGAKELNLGATPKRLGLHGTNNTGDFGGNMICALDGIPNQPWTATCVGTGTPFVVSGDSLAPVSCNGASRREGPVAGRK